MSSPLAGGRAIHRTLWAFIIAPALLLVFLSGCTAVQSQAGGDPQVVAEAARSSSADAPSSGEGSRRLRSAPDFTLALFDGGKFTLSDVGGKPVVLNFWASWCGPCREEMPGLERAWRAYKGRGVVFLGVDIQDDEKDARAFLKEMGITYPVGRDATNRIPIGYSVSGIPSTFFINREGKVARGWVGSITEKQLVAFIEELL